MSSIPSYHALAQSLKEMDTHLNHLKKLEVGFQLFAGQEFLLRKLSKTMQRHPTLLTLPGSL